MKDETAEKMMIICFWGALVSWTIYGICQIILIIMKSEAVRWIRN